MNFLHYQNDRLFADSLSVKALAEQYGTPLYVYHKESIENEWNNLNDALKDTPHLICYAVKTNSNLAVLNTLAQLGSGFDIVSQGELERVIKAGGDPKKVVFSGVAKSEAEIRRSLEVGIKCFNIESPAELERVNNVAKDMGKTAPISVRINPDVDAKTHPYISTGLKDNKFGISYESVISVYQRAASLENIEIVGIDCHIGSQLTELKPFVDACEKVLHIVDQLAELGIQLKHIDLGGGLGICYNDETPPTSADLVNALMVKLNAYPHLEVIFEPGRRIVGNAGILITEVEYTKHQNGHHFGIVNAGMNTLIRPALYDAWMKIIPENLASEEPEYAYKVVGPICESTDVLGKDRHLKMAEGDLLVICSAGAYGFVLASNYNSHPLPAEVMIANGTSRIIRKRQTFDDLWEGEQL